MMQDTIFIYDLAVDSLIGVLPHERVQQQKLIIDIELQTDFSAAIASDNVADAINYAAVSEHIIRFADNAEYGLLESFGQALVDSLFTAFSITTITLTITKPGAVLHTRNIGIKMQRQRPDNAQTAP